MFTFNEYVPANQIWATAKNHEDRGNIDSLVRGYNIEVITKDGKIEWLSASYIHGDPENYFNDEFHLWMYNEHSWTPTGRICFRGYGCEVWSYEEREYFVSPIEDEDVDAYIAEAYINENEFNEDEEW